jgi:hypothetical protein
MSRDVLDTKQYRGYTIELVSDPDPESPREWDNFGKLICWHRRYTLGDEQPKSTPDDYLKELLPGYVLAELQDREDRAWQCKRDEKISHECYDKIMERLDVQRERAQQKWLTENLVMLPLYLYDHGGITMSTGSFSCSWDSGRVGFTYATLEMARANWCLSAKDATSWDFLLDDWDDKGKKTGQKITLRKAAERLLIAEVEEYDQYLRGDVVGWRVEGDAIDHDSCWGYYDRKHAMDDAEGAVDAHIKQITKKHTEKVKSWIKNQVPLLKRQSCPA